MLLSIDIKEKQFLHDGVLKNILKDVSFQISQGDFLSILGISGVGKTTLLKIILGLDTDFKGNITYSNREKLKQSIVFQEHRLLPWKTVWQNIAFALPSDMPNDLKQKKVTEVLELVGLIDYKNAWIKELSGGMAQRVSIARALVNEPSLLLLDEPFASLDAFTKRDIQKQLKNIIEQKNLSCIMVTHDFDEAIYMSNKIDVLGNNPATFIAEKEIVLSDTENRTSKEFHHYQTWLHNVFFN